MLRGVLILAPHGRRFQRLRRRKNGGPIRGGNRAVTMSDTYAVLFQGAVVECDSRAEADTLGAAEVAIERAPACNESPMELDRMAGLLRTYALNNAAESVAHLASRILTRTQRRESWGETRRRCRV